VVEIFSSSIGGSIQQPVFLFFLNGREHTEIKIKYKNKRTGGSQAL
jgi:hypothetical protein